MHLLRTLALAACALALLPWQRMYRAVAFHGSARWPTVPATVEEVVVKSITGGYRIGGGNKSVHCAEIRYSYQVNATWYGGSCKTEFFPSDENLEALTAQYPTGATVQIHVHPKKPTVSVLNL